MLSLVLTETCDPSSTRSILPVFPGTVADRQVEVHHVVKAGARPVLDSGITRHTARAPHRPARPTHCL